MWPTFYQIDGPNPVALHSYGLLVTLGLAGSMAYVFLRAGKVGLPLDRLAISAVAAVVGGFLGAKVVYALATGDLPSLVSASGGLAWYGGVLGGGLAVIATASMAGVDAWKVADVAAPALALGAGIGRIGCLMAGCCHGVAVPQPDPRTALLPEGLLEGQIWLHPHFPFLSTEFHGGVARLVDVPLYPTQLWQSVGSFLMLGLLLAVAQRRRFDGQVAAWWLVLDPVLRLFVESFRGDHRGYVVSWAVSSVPSWLPGLGAAGPGGETVIGITTSQGIGLAMILLGAALMWWRRNAGVSEEAGGGDAWVDDLVD